MIARALTAVFLCFAAAPVAAKDPVLHQPIECTLGQDCYIQQYVDHDASPTAYDFRCQSLSYNKHKGTDFALPTTAQMQRGVNVLAAAAGTVLRVRDGMPDQIFSAKNAGTVNGRECGNAVVITHGDGWETQYCHLKQGSLKVKRGQKVDSNTVLGQVGLSGRTQFPHLHLSVRKDGKVVDPFDPDNKIVCNAPDQSTLWQNPIPYQPGAILSVGFHDGIPEYSDVKSGSANMPSLTKDAPAVAVFGYAFGARKGDQMQLKLTGPDGTIANEKIKVTKNRAQMFRATGRKLRGAGWPVGTYKGSAALVRDGQVISIKTTEIEIR